MRIQHRGLGDADSECGGVEELAWNRGDDVVVHVSKNTFTHQTMWQPNPDSMLWTVAYNLYEHSNEKAANNLVSVENAPNSIYTLHMMVLSVHAKLTE